MKYRIPFLLSGLVMVAGCNAGSPASPDSYQADHAVLQGGSAAAQENGVVEIGYEKWFLPGGVMTGDTDLGRGTFAGLLLGRTAFANGVIVKLEATYQVTDPAGIQSFTAHVEGSENLVTNKAVLNGVITSGWREGSQVHVEFDVISPCFELHNRATCFTGTIRIQG
jgi:hypothetical protein